MAVPPHSARTALPAPQCPHCLRLQCTHLQDSLHIPMQVSLWPRLLRSCE